MITQSNIAYIISLLKNGQDMWDQELDIAKNQDKGGEVEKKNKAPPLFTSGMRKKQSFGVSLGKEYYYTTEKSWNKVYNLKKLFSKLCNEWERWEPKDKGDSKQALKTWWKKDLVNESRNEYKQDDGEAWYDKGG